MSRREKQKKLLTGFIMLAITMPFLISSGLRGDSLYLMPYIALGVMAVSSLWLIVKAALTPTVETEEKGREEEQRQAVTGWEIAGCFAFLFAVVLLMGVVGSYVMLFVLLFVSHLYISHRQKKVSLLRTLIFSVIAIAIVYLVFGKMLGLRLPRDVWLF